EFGVAEGEVSNDYYFDPKRNVSWKMSNEYLRKYLWMRGAFGARVFFYQAVVPDRAEFRALMKGEEYVQLKAKDGWYDLILRQHRHGLLLQVWGAATVVTPELCEQQSADGLIWPGVHGAMTKDRANALIDIIP